jgi:hypothetical protein
MRRTAVGALVLVFAASVAGVPSAEPAPASISSLSWLAGCWEGGSGTRVVDEQWMAPRGGMMLGMGRTVVGAAVREFEQMFIREDGGKLVFTSRPSEQPEASFASIEVTPSRVVFENLGHDFPQRVMYEKGADGSLKARIEGKQGDTVKGIDFPMRRAACPSQG